MHDIWNPWHGCHKYSEGCLNCYMYYLDKVRNRQDSNQVTKLMSNLYYPLKRDKNGEYKVKSGEQIRVCMTSDFFIEEADSWREEIWQIISMRQDVVFYILTKRANRIKEHLPKDWNEEWENVIINVTCENQLRIDERMPILLEIPAKHKGVMVAPMLGPVDLSKYLVTGQIDQVICGGENYENPRVCNYDWVKDLSLQCQRYNVLFSFIETGTKFMKDGKLYHIKSKELQAEQAGKSKLSFKGKKIEYKLYNHFHQLLTLDEQYKKKYKKHCYNCGGNLTCNGCSNCGKCSDKGNIYYFEDLEEKEG